MTYNLYNIYHLNYFRIKFGFSLAANITRKIFRVVIMHYIFGKSYQNYLDINHKSQQSDFTLDEACEILYYSNVSKRYYVAVP